jgi:hypothetical protein
MAGIFAGIAREANTGTTKIPMDGAQDNDNAGKS